MKLSPVSVHSARLIDNLRRTFEIAHPHVAVSYLLAFICVLHKFSAPYI